MPDRAIIYARVSTDEQSGNTSLDGQIEASEAYCKEKGYLVVRRVKEEYTGTSATRPELNQILESPELFDVLVAFSVDRFARRLAVQVLLEKELSEHGKRVEYVVGGGEDTPEGHLLQQMQAVISEYEVQQILRRTSRGKVGRAKSGKLLVGRTPAYGYNYVDGHYVIAKDESRIVKRIFKWYTESGLGLRSIAKKLEQLGIPTKYDTLGYRKRKKRAGWGKTSVYKILTNKTFLGTWTFDGLQKVDVAVPAIIDETLFNRAQEQIKKNRIYSKRNTKNKYLLRSRITCSHCGYKFSSMGMSKGLYYRCAGQKPSYADNASGKRCVGMIKAEDLDAKVWEWIEHILMNPANIEEYMDEKLNEKPDEDLRRILEEQMDSLNDRHERLMVLYEDGNISQELLDERISLATKDILQAQDQFAALKKPPPKPHLDFEEIASKLGSKISNISFKKKEQIVSLLDVQVIANRTRKGKLKGYLARVDTGDGILSYEF